MGVTGLWTVVQPCARPIKIETLNKKRLAVDASIWIYQFLKAVRDKEGNALRNSHVVGFFRRICKLLFYGIKPVFVFDGGAPALKRQTINNRKQRREGRREDAVRTAGKLLAVQMQRRAEEEEQKRKEQKQRGSAAAVDEELLPENLVYADEVTMSAQERQQNRRFKKKDAYHLPELDVSLSEMGGPNDPRVMSVEELEQYARQFESGEDINVYDFSKIDFDGPFFQSLPASDRYNILNAARLRSRLRMGYSKEQLDSMFQDRMAFSKFQIDRVRERNELTQRLMNINNGDALFGMDSAGRVAGERDREYVLVKNEGVEGGWALGVVDKDEGKWNKPIEVDRSSPPKEEEEEWEEDDDFEDVPVEGLNRLPKQRPVVENDRTSDLMKRRQAFYKSRRAGPSEQRRHSPKPRNEDPESLFVADKEEDEAEEWENVDIGMNDELFEEGEQAAGSEDEELQRAIAMSLEQDKPEQPEQHTQQEQEVDEDDDFLEVFQQKAEEPKPFYKGSGLAIARMANQRSSKAAVPAPTAIVSEATLARDRAPPSAPFAESDSETDEVDLQAALAESRKSKHQPRQRPQPSQRPEPTASTGPTGKSTTEPSKAKAGPFSGPLPFERLDLGSSLLGRKKMQKLAEDQAGGFEKNDEKSKGAPLPPWFAEGGDIRDEFAAQKKLEAEYREQARREREREDEFQFQEQPRLRKHDTREVIDLDEESEPEKEKEVINIESSDDEDLEMEDVMPVDSEVRIGDLADKVRAEPPLSSPPTVGDATTISPPKGTSPDQGKAKSPQPVAKSPCPQEHSNKQTTFLEQEAGTSQGRGTHETDALPVGGQIQPAVSKSSSPEFEIVTGTEQSPQNFGAEPTAQPVDAREEEGPVPMSGLADQELLDDQEDDQSVYSDPEDAELFQQLATEAEEHARFASTLNNKSQETNAMDYERELKALRSQQKRDRRDADEVTQTMIAECQQLLALFGLPYITAPMEAEAQCAELVHLGLVDGIVTDDSDTFLFGGTRVYKNMFNQAKFVECYLTQDLEAEFNLTRDNLIAIAQLLGSDYTEGLPGVGPVTALEILSEFGSLPAFQEWWTAVQSGTRPAAADQPSPFRRKFRKTNAAKLFLAPGFPDPRVADAYLAPAVDKDATAFAWGVPDLDALRRFLSATVGWSQERTDEVLVPVIRDLNRRETEGTQSNITSFFGGGVGAGAFAPRKRVEGKSRRLESALGKLGKRGRGGGGSEGEGEVVEGGKEERRKTQTTTTSKKGRKKRRTAATEEENDDDDASTTIPENGDEDDNENANDSTSDYARTSKPKKGKSTKGTKGTKPSSTSTRTRRH
ncbi:uncharacterized protein K452DRAFT_41757 [Aplosporella prunicola CBS 121167]|uniref:PIN domain-like protein n=1 Tax=Aplosporella prunicola CBS 121167 TaxID=1176127 RepID=A0A6A6BED7_9PEZI|nr:uncharacterized protein K452DRAFT_41757 [Aplosporella prunicola CBS 121167]KAF2140851.1 hypothetical protein K452DRAFT_41757 [Aplosporella prunicola CBS 121167]